MLYHVGVTKLAGGWIGINHFFVFSGFLIARMLIKEHSKTGRIDALRFYRRRIRRIVPAMVALVLAVVVHSWIFETAANRKQFGGDAFATLGFFLNWRLVTRFDAYFDLFGHPSPLRHAWTLAVEEQFYVIAPLLLLLVCMATRSRRIRAGIAFGLACVSAIWTAHLGYHGVTDQSRLYYGTDTRAQALLVGVAIGFLLGADQRGREPRPLSRGATHFLAWLGFLTSLSAVFILSPTTGWIWNGGGMLLFAAAAALMGFAAIDQRDLFINRCSPGRRWPTSGGSHTACTCITGRSTSGCRCRSCRLRWPRPFNCCSRWPWRRCRSSTSNCRSCCTECAGYGVDGRYVEWCRYPP